MMFQNNLLVIVPTVSKEAVVLKAICGDITLNIKSQKRTDKLTTKSLYRAELTKLE